VVVGPREALATRLIRVTDMNWLGDVPLEALGEKGMEVAVRVRSTREPRPATLRSTGTATTVELLSAEDGVSPGQACVIYESDAPRARVLGGGTIARTVAEAAPAAA
jgi:tRNA-specific 2-thiouridylase